jgi:hypothetical protein
MKQWTGLIIVLMLVVAGCKAPKPTDATPDSGVANIHSPQLVSPSDADTDVPLAAPAVRSEAPAVTSEPETDEDTDEDTDTTP